MDRLDIFNEKHTCLYLCRIENIQKTKEKTLVYWLPLWELGGWKTGVKRDFLLMPFPTILILNM